LGVAELDPGELLQMLVQEPGVIDHGLQDERLAQRNGGAVAAVHGARGELRASRAVALAAKRSNRRQGTAISVSAPRHSPFAVRYAPVARAAAASSVARRLRTGVAAGRRTRGANICARSRRRSSPSPR